MIPSVGGTEAYPIEVRVNVAYGDLILIHAECRSDEPRVPVFEMHSLQRSTRAERYQATCVLGINKVRATSGLQHRNYRR